MRVAKQEGNPPNCPVNVSLIYIRMLSYPVNVNGLMQPRILQGAAGQRGDANRALSYSTALQDLKALIAATGRDGNAFGEHSGRRGGATAATEAGAQWADLKKLGRWASDSAPQLYVENTEKRRSALPRLLAAAAQQAAAGSGRGSRPLRGPREASREAAASLTDHGDQNMIAPAVVLPPCGEPLTGPVVSLPDFK